MENGFTLDDNEQNVGPSHPLVELFQYRPPRLNRRIRFAGITPSTSDVDPDENLNNDLSDVEGDENTENITLGGAISAATFVERLVRYFGDDDELGFRPNPHDSNDGAEMITLR